MNMIDYDNKINKKHKQKGVPMSKELLTRETQTNFIIYKLQYNDIVQSIKISERKAWERHEKGEYMKAMSAQDKLDFGYEEGCVINGFGTSFQKIGIHPTEPKNSGKIVTKITMRSGGYTPTLARTKVRWKENGKWVLYHTVPNGWRYRGMNSTFEYINPVAVTFKPFETKNNKKKKKTKKKKKKKKKKK
jgi:hypothetical protein